MYDPLDQNAWNGVGSTAIDVFVNDLMIYSHTKGWGYLENYIILRNTSLDPSYDTAVAIDYFAVEAVPEPASLSLLAFASLALLRRRK